MEFRILGPLEVVEQDAPLRLGGGKQRALLAVLLLHANEVVSTDRLVEELWGEDRPPTAAKIVQVYVPQLRRLLADGALLTRRPGYVLRVEPADLDLARFEQLVAEARTSEPAAAAEKLREALALWRGPPLADFAYEQFAQTEIARLEELRLAAVEARIAADLELGRDAELVGELEALVSEHPLRERLRGQLMLALYRCGRQAEALEAYRRGRRLLADELGLEPNVELQELEKAILVQDPSLAPPAALTGPGEPTERPAARGGPVFVGRQRELGELLQGLEDVISGRGRLFLVTGEPGIGKSRLADELINHARARGARVLVGRCWEAGGAPAYWPWVQMIRACAREANPESLRSELGAGAADVAQIVPELRELFPDLPEPVSPESEGARFRLFDSTTAFLRNAAAKRPLVLVLDDLHAADEPSLLLLQFVARELGESSVLLAAAYRDVDPLLRDPLTTALTELVREPITRTLHLTGLDEPDVASFIELTTARMPAQGLASAVYSETEGNPLFVGEIVRLLALEGRLEDPAGPIGIPQSVKEVIGRRLRHLSGECNRVLVLASVLGREFDLDVLERLSGSDREGLLEALDEATAARVVSDVPGAIARLRFAHELIRDVVYEALPRARRFQLHREVGEALEALHERDLELHLAELAHHFFEAVPGGEADKAITYARRAAARAADLLAYEEALRLYRQALRLLTRDPSSRVADRCELLIAIGDAQARAGDTPASKHTLREAAELARAEDLPEHLARAALGYGGRMIWDVSRDDESLVPLLEAALAALGEVDSPLRVRLLARLAGGPLRDVSFPPERKASLSTEGLEMARRIGDPATLAYGIGGYILGHHSPDHVPRQLELATELVKVAGEARDKERLIDGYEHLVVSLVELGQMPRAKAALEAMATLAEELRQPAQEWLVGVHRGLIALLEGRFAEAEGLISGTFRLGASVQSWSAAVSSRLQLYLLRREQGHLREVEALIRRSADEYPTYPIWRCVLASMTAELGLGAESGELFDALAADRFAALPFDEEWLVSMSFLAETARHLGDGDRTEAMYELMLPYAGRVAVSYPEISTGSVSRYLGILASVVGRWDEAARHFEDALELNGRMGARPWVAHTQRDYARMLEERGSEGDPERAAALLADAAGIRRELGLT